ncbi:MAG: hypothetical protein R3E68_22115 [Burkholderiaceae bacterium]
MTEHSIFRVIPGAGRWRSAGAAVCALLSLGGAIAGEADVLKAVASQQGDEWRFEVTIRSQDRGWDYYCDRFEIVDGQGRVLGTRILFHPHETEQPFTRDLGGVRIPDGVRSVTVRAAMKPGGAGGEQVDLVLPGR